MRRNGSHTLAGDRAYAAAEGFPTLYVSCLPDRFERPAATIGAGLCEACGSMTGARVPLNAPKTYTGYEDHLALGVGAVCVGCAVLLNGGPEQGEKRVRRWTFFSLATDGQTSLWLDRTQTPRIAELVADDRWSVCVVEQGRRHVAHRTPLTRPGRVRVAFDGQLVDVPRQQWLDLTRAIAAARATGITKTTLASGSLSHDAYYRLGLGAAREIADQIGRHAGTAALRLAVMLDTTNKEEGSTP